VVPTSFCRLVVGRSVDGRSVGRAHAIVDSRACALRAVRGYDITRLLLLLVVRPTIHGRALNSLGKRTHVMFDFPLSLPCGVAPVK
jgi:hypothetical protein